MARLLLPLAVVAALAPFASAAPSFTNPKAGETLKAGESIVVKWDDSGDSPKLTDLTTYQLFLCAGGSEEGSYLPVRPITVQGLFSVSTNGASALIDAAAGEDSPKNAYFLKMIAVGKTGGQLITFSERFSYSGMTGAFPQDPKVQAGLKSFDGTKGPAVIDQLAKVGEQGKPVGAAGDYDMAYTMQTGLTRYAPMQPQPPTKITATNTKPLFPTSSVQIAKSHLPIPKVQTTVTQSQTFSVSSRANTVAPAAHATDDMAKFLRRWED